MRTGTCFLQREEELLAMVGGKFALKFKLPDFQRRAIPTLRTRLPRRGSHTRTYEAPKSYYVHTCIGK